MTPKACVIGGGPSGIFISKYLAKYGITVDLYEKQDHLLGNYAYSRYPSNVIKNLQSDKINIFLNSEIKNEDLEKYNFFVVATGAAPRPLDIKGGKLALNALDVIKKMYFFRAPTELHQKEGDKDIDDSVMNERQKPFSVLSIMKQKIVKRVKSFDVLSVLNRFFLFSLIKDRKYVINTSKANNLLGTDKCLQTGNSDELGLLKYSIPVLKDVKSLEDQTIKNLKNKNICIIGLGNVTLDLISYLKGFARSITVLSRSSLQSCPIDNYVLKDTIDNKIYLNKVTDAFLPTNSNIGKKKHSFILDKLKHSVLDKVYLYIGRIFNIPIKTELNIISEVEVKEIKSEDTKKAVSYLSDSKLNKEIFDEVISSVGFIPRRINIDTQKPVYYLGWADKPKGNIGDVQVAAKELADKILHTNAFKLKYNNI